MKSLTIRHKLYLFLVFFGVLSIVSGTLTYFGIEKLNKLYINIEKVGQFEYNIAKLKQYEASFLLKESKNLEFYKSGESAYLDSTESIILKTQSLLSELRQKGTSSSLAELDSLGVLLNVYKKQFSVVKEKMLSKGFKDYGYVGQMRSVIHKVEDDLNALPNNLKLNVLMLLLRRHEKDFLLRNDPKYEVKFDKVIGQFINRLNMRANTTSFKEYILSYQKLFHQVVKIEMDLSAKNNGEIIRASILLDEMGPISNLLAKKIKLEANTHISRTKSEIKYVLFIGTFIALVFLMSIIRTISKSLKKTIQIIEDVSNGNISNEFDIYRKDELGLILEKIKTMNTYLQETVGGILSESKAVNQLAIDIEKIALEIKLDVLQQNSVLKEVDSILQQMGKIIDQNYTSSVSSVDVSTRANATLAKGNDVLVQSIASINEVISKIHVVNDIANQTNLLALNASVEAARAGKYGAGFSVVALEVRNLSERSMKVVKEVSDVTAESSKISQEAQGILATIVPEIRATLESATFISSSTEAQKKNAQSIQQLDIVSTQSESNSLLLNSMSQSLLKKSSDLKQKVSVFTLN